MKIQILGKEEITLLNEVISLAQRKVEEIKLESCTNVGSTMVKTPNHVNSGRNQIK